MNAQVIIPTAPTTWLSQTLQTSGVMITAENVPSNGGIATIEGIFTPSVTGQLKLVAAAEVSGAAGAVTIYGTQGTLQK
jgi:hypothetical protein